MNSTGKSFVPLLVLTGFILVVGFILYQAGFRVTTTTPPAEQQQARQPGQHQRRQARAEGLPGKPSVQESAGGAQGGRASNRGGRRGGAVEVRSGALGTEKIPVIGKGTERSFTGADLEKLPQTTIVSSHGVRAGWRLADVLNQLALTQGTEVVLTAEDGKTLNIPWEKITGHEPTLLLTYNSFGGLMLLSGKEVTPEEIQGLDNQAVKTLWKQMQAESTSFMKVNKIEVKS